MAAPAPARTTEPIAARAYHDRVPKRSPGGNLAPKQRRPGRRPAWPSRRQAACLT